MNAVPGRGRLLALAAALALAGCASRAPAPVESRTKPPAAPAKSTQAPPAPAAGAQPAEAAGAQTAPVRPSGVESRPLGKPAESRAAVPPPLLRKDPKVLKRPYSEATLAEMRAADAAVAVPGSPTARPGDAAGAPATGAAAAGASAGSAAAAGTAAAGTAEARPAARPEAKADAKTEVKPEARQEPRPAGGAADFAWPARGRVIQSFGEPSKGISIAGSLGDPVSATADGKVIFSGPGPRGYGNLLIVQHDPETVSVYAHNRKLLVKEQETVKRGQKIAELGDSGTDKPQLHFEIRKSGRPVDPQKLLPAR